MIRKIASPKKTPVQKAASKRQKHVRSLEEAVGADVYRVWVSMLRALVPDGRTQRLAPLLAAMLQYALAAAEERRDEEANEESVIQSLLDSHEASDASEVRGLLHDVVDRLFKDAGVQDGRSRSHGQAYSIADDAYEEYVHWFDTPWE